MSGVDIAGLVSDYDAGVLNDWGGGNVDWWQDYLRAEIGRANDFWRSQIESLSAAQAAELAEARATIKALECEIDCHAVEEEGFEQDLLTLSRQRDEALAALKASEEPSVQQLVWDEMFVDRGDGSKDHSGWEAPNGFGLYYTIEMYFGSDSYGWQVEYDGRVVSDHDDPEAAKASAQRHFEGLVRSALVGSLADATNNPPSDPGTEQREAGRG